MYYSTWSCSPFILCTKINSYLYSTTKRKREEIWLSPVTKSLIPIEMSNGQRDNTKTPPNSSITQRLRTDLGRSVWVATVAQLVWLSGLRAKHSHSPQQPWNILIKKLHSTTNCFVKGVCLMNRMFRSCKSSLNVNYQTFTRDVVLNYLFSKSSWGMDTIQARQIEIKPETSSPEDGQ